MSVVSACRPIGVMVTNDDGPPGPAAPFLLPFSRALVRVLGSGARVFVCTPAKQQSWTGKSLAHCGAGDGPEVRMNWADPPDAERLLGEARQSGSGEVALWAQVEGSPACAANVGLTLLSPFGLSGVDLVISGPNLGRNTGRSFMLSSGTIGAAIEASFVAGVRAIALSFAYDRNVAEYSTEQVDTACDVAVRVVLALYANWPSAPSRVGLFSVNVPVALSAGMDTRVITTHVLRDDMGALYLRRDTQPEPNPDSELRHRVALRFCVDWSRQGEGAVNWVGSDLWAVRQGWVSVTPLSLSSLSLGVAHTDPALGAIFDLFR